MRTLFVLLRKITRVNNEKNCEKSSVTKNRSICWWDTAMPVGMGVLCIASAYVLWRRKSRVIKIRSNDLLLILWGGGGGGGGDRKGEEKHEYDEMVTLSCPFIWIAWLDV